VFWHEFAGVALHAGKAPKKAKLNQRVGAAAFQALAITQLYRLTKTESKRIFELMCPCVFINAFLLPCCCRCFFAANCNGKRKKS
jgi:hypothetical protein